MSTVPKPTSSSKGFPSKTYVGMRLWVGGHNTAAKREIEPHLAGAVRPGTGPIDAGVVAALTTDECLYFANKLRGRLSVGGTLWILYVPEPSAAPGLTGRALRDAATSFADWGFAEHEHVRITDDLFAARFHRTKS